MERKESIQTLREELREGFGFALPLIVSVVPFALLWGTLARQAGLSALETSLMAGLVFAGSAQFIAVEIWTAPPAVMTLVLATLIINLRHVLMGAALAPYLRGWGWWKSHAALFFMADEVWALALQKRTRGPLTASFYFAVAATFYVGWLIFTAAGYRAGGLIEDPAVYGFDFAFAAVFLCLIRSFYVEWRSLLPWAVSALAAALAYSLIEGVWYILLGGIAGALTGALFPAKPKRPKAEGALPS
ncbi:AzlC family ABC transporter permease [Limibacillus halophilus]|jgi:4-azaleucine resistance transporter AzlC